jgi:hypothetical protein
MIRIKLNDTHLASRSGEGEDRVPRLDVGVRRGPIQLLKVMRA